VATAATFELTVREEKNHAVKFPVVESPVNKKALELVRRMETGIKKEACDVIVIGTGPAGLALASQLSNRGLKVTCVGDNPSRRWIPNYGVWLDEFLPLGYPVSCLAKQWSTTSVSLEPEGGKKVLQRPYGRVDRQALQEELLERCLRGGVKFVTGRALSISHDRDDSSLLTYGDGSEQRCRVAVDATGHPSKFIEFARDQTALHLADAASGSTSATRSQGYQAAYGIEAEVAGHPFDLDDMLLMDFRGDHLTPDERANEPPTFLYAMPMSKTRVFLEETSLVARPPLSFDLLKDRLYRRLQHLNVTVTAVEEVEYCLIPMGGDLPSMPQRVLAFGGAARMVHPATGYMLTRALAAAPPLADALADAIHQGREDVWVSGWEAVWGASRRQERDFYKFGMEVLLDLNLPDTRIFFDRFFSLPDHLWHRFLSQHLRVPEILQFGLTLFARSPNALRFDLFKSGFVHGGLPLVRTLTGL